MQRRSSHERSLTFKRESGLLFEEDNFELRLGKRRFQPARSQAFLIKPSVAWFTVPYGKSRPVFSFPSTSTTGTNNFVPKLSRCVSLSLSPCSLRAFRWHIAYMLDAAQEPEEWNGRHTFTLRARTDDNSTVTAGWTRTGRRDSAYKFAI